MTPQDRRPPRSSAVIDRLGWFVDLGFAVLLVLVVGILAGLLG